VIDTLKHLLIGPPLPTGRLLEERLNKIRALAAFSPAALSSIAYADQEIYLGLAVAGSAGLSLAFPIGFAITALLVLVALSYLQTIQAYPSGGGSYVVSRENLGVLPGLVAGAALLIDYVLTAAVSLTAGVDAIGSAFPALWSYRVEAALFLLVVITVLNLRGLRETGTLMAVPVYLFLAAYLPLLAYGALRLLTSGHVACVVGAPSAAVSLTPFLVLRAFSSGCTALTGVEAISNGVPAFQVPQSKNAGRTLIVMAVLMGVLFLGSVGLIQWLDVAPGSEETVLSALTRRLVGSGPIYLLIQMSTLLVLAVAANTSFAGFPQVTALLAMDAFLPRQLRRLGDRLVFANGILLLSAATGALIVAFRGNSHALIPLFAVGAFLAFTLSQAGMVVHWWRVRGGRWRLKTGLNGIGALATGITLLVVAVSKFVQGAWITVLGIPVLVAVFLKIRSHYRGVADQLSMAGMAALPPSASSPRVVIPVAGVHRGIVDAVAYAKSIARDVMAVYVELEPGSGQGVRERWERWWPEVPLVILPSPYRSMVGPLLDFLDETDRQHGDGQLATVVLPEFVPARPWHALLHNQTAWLIKAALLYRRRQLGFQRTVIDVPYHLGR
jgi:amino acid transporter